MNDCWELRRIFNKFVNRLFVYSLDAVALHCANFIAFRLILWIHKLELKSFFIVVVHYKLDLIQSMGFVVLMG